MLGPDQLGLAVGLTVAAIAYGTTVYRQREHFHLDAFLAGLRRRDAEAPQPGDRAVLRFRDHSPVNAEAASPSSVDITDYVAVIRRHWKLVVACGLGLMVLAVLYSFTRPTVYVSRAQIALPDSQCGNAGRSPPSTRPPSSRS